MDRDLMETDLPFVNAPWLQAYFTPPEQYSTQMKKVLRLSDDLVTELLTANHLVVATPHPRRHQHHRRDLHRWRKRKAVDLGKIGMENFLDRFQGEIEAAAA